MATGIEAFEAVNTVTPRLNDLARAIEGVASDCDFRIEVSFPLDGGLRVYIELDEDETSEGHYAWSVT